MAGLIGFAPIYLNGVLAVLFVLVLPGIVFVRALDIPSFPQKWFVVLLSSLTANHFLVTLIAALHLQPVQTYRVVALALIAALILLTVKERAAPPAYRSGSTIFLSDIFWLVLALVFLGFTYINVWKHGVPNIFEAGDVSVSWNTWALIWSQAQFPVYALGYQQFVPTIWAVTYIFTGSTEQYFAFYIYLAWIVVPVVLTAMSLGRLGWWQPLVPCIALGWLVAEIRDPWLRSCLEQGFPDWVATIFAFCGVVLFVSDAPEGRYDREKITTALISLCLVSIAAATKPQYAVFTAAVLIAMCADALKYLQPREQTKLIAVAIGLVSAFAAAYAIYYLQIAFRRIPDQSLPILERLSSAFALFNSNFSLPFRIVLYAGVAISPFVPRVRWFSLPLIIGISAWAVALSYDLRNLIGFLPISAFIPFFALARAFAPTRVFPIERRWRVPDGAVACGLALLYIGLSFSLAKGDEELKRRFAAEQLVKGAGPQVNQRIEHLLLNGCTIINADSYLYTISAFGRFESRMPYFHFEAPITDGLKRMLDDASGCTGIIYPFNITHPSILSYVSAKPDFAKVVEDRGWTLRVSNPAGGGN
ncbi:hypothetical protein IVB30_11580 [Bradyrhizobium sp. 200]|uniref:hypothetical protein n=1 Tax=Bradyrhizobium sp. 200 TaxID=2782665 RepID=UPI001FFE35D8|nr:hypothetical protein [Bradyrhizobium sp. 200]UPJ51923.1 hypothetical protein IVB30_11580 [Bradyrhizobium sp. 200]